MSLFAIGLGLLSAGAAGAFGYSLYQGHQKMTRLLDMQTLLRESQATHFHHLNLATESVLSDMRTLQSTLDALRTIHPEVDASLTVHSFLLQHEGSDALEVDVQEACDALRSIDNGGGGYGDPREREMERVLHDVREGYISAEAARDVYGIAITGSVDDETLAVDKTATAELRD